MCKYVILDESDSGWDICGVDGLLCCGLACDLPQRNGEEDVHYDVKRQEGGES
jgi:hypothetical protein